MEYMEPGALWESHGFGMRVQDLPGLPELWLMVVWVVCSAVSIQSAGASGSKALLGSG